jgi:hypothetical protein
VFLGIYIVAWDATLPLVAGKLNETLAANEASGAPSAAPTPLLRSTFLMALVLYASVVCWLQLIFFMMLLYVVTTLGTVAAPYAGITIAGVDVGAVIRLLADPVHVFDCLTVRHIPFHALATAGFVAAGCVAATVYITQRDITRDDMIRSKFTRIAFGLPAVGACLYFVYMLFCMSVAN